MFREKNNTCYEIPFYVEERKREQSGIDKIEVLWIQHSGKPFRMTKDMKEITWFYINLTSFSKMINHRYSL